MVLIHSEVKMSQRSSIHSPCCGVQFFIHLLEEMFTTCTTSLTEPHNLQQPGFPLSSNGYIFLSICRTIISFQVYFGDNIFRTPISTKVKYRQIPTGPFNSLIAISQILGDTWPDPIRVSPCLLHGEGWRGGLKWETLGTRLCESSKFVTEETSLIIAADFIIQGHFTVACTASS